MEVPSISTCHTEFSSKSRVPKTTVKSSTSPFIISGCKVVLEFLKFMSLATFVSARD